MSRLDSDQMKFFFISHISEESLIQKKTISKINKPKNFSNIFIAS